MSFIEIKDLRKNFGQTQVLRGLSLSLPEKSQCVLQGSSGSGKSTLLYIIGGLDHADAGQIVVAGKSLKEFKEEELAHYRNQFIGFVFQFHYLLPSMDSLSNILLPSRIAGQKNVAVEKRVRELAGHLGVSHCLNKYSFELSGGEQQRINIIRALSLKPKLLLCDEPTGNLDSENSQKVTTLLKDLSHELGTTLLVVTHDLRVAEQFSQQINITDGMISSTKLV
ncbi:MAG: ABC transporter ATP-binding protein [Bacteriovoracaceae bacterium]